MIRRLFWKLAIGLNSNILEGDSKLLKMFIDFEAYKQNFITTYMAEQGYNIPAVTSVVLKNGYTTPIAIHFFIEEHMTIDHETDKIQPVYTDDLLHTEYYLSEAQ